MYTVYVMPPKRAKSEKRVEMRKEQSKFPQILVERQKRFGNFISSHKANLRPDGKLVFGPASKPVFVQFRRQERGKEVRLLHYSKGTAIVDPANFNLLRFVLKKK